MEALKRALEVKEEDIRHLTMQLELKNQESKAKQDQLELQLSELQVPQNTFRFLTMTRLASSPT